MPESVQTTGDVRDAVLLHLLRDDVLLGDHQLLFVGVAGEADDFHAVEERRLDRVEHVRRDDEHHVRQVVRHAEVVIAEREVLLGVEHFEQRRRRIAAIVGADLVDLVEHEHRVRRSAPG